MLKVRTLTTLMTLLMRMLLAQSRWNRPERQGTNLMIMMRLGSVAKHTLWRTTKPHPTVVVAVVAAVAAVMVLL